MWERMLLCNRKRQCKYVYVYLFEFSEKLVEHLWTLSYHWVEASSTKMFKNIKLKKRTFLNSHFSLKKIFPATKWFWYKSKRERKRALVASSVVNCPSMAEICSLKYFVLKRFRITKFTVSIRYLQHKNDSKRNSRKREKVLEASKCNKLSSNGWILFESFTTNILGITMFL